MEKKLESIKVDEVCPESRLCETKFQENNSEKVNP